MTPASSRTRHSSERGIAMITTLLVMMLISAVLVGFTAVVMSDQRYRFIDKDRGQAFYAASGGVEKLTADLGNQFFTTIAPTAAQITALTTTPPTISGITYTGAAPSALPSSPMADLTATGCGPAPKVVKIVGGSGYTVMFCADATGNPVTTGSAIVCCGAYAGLTALKTPYQLDVTAKTSTGGEAHLIRTMEAVAIPVFQFGMFSDVDLSFFAGSNFSFGGRVHTNGNLFLAEGGGTTLTLTDKVTAVGSIVRQQLQNGVAITVSPTHDGTVSMAKAAGSYRNLAATEGSVTAGLGSSTNPNWQTISLGTYNSYITNGATGAKALNLPLLTVGGSNPDLIRRPPAGEDVSNSILFNERMFSKASLRVLLSDTAADITSLPTVTAAAPVSLGTTVADTNWNTTPPAGYGPVDSAHPPIARTPGPQAMTVNGVHNAGWTTLKVNAMPAYYQMPALTATKGATVRAITCTGRTSTTLLGCVNPATSAAWSTGNLTTTVTVTTAANAVDFTTPVASTTATWSNSTTTLTVDNVDDFSPAWLYVTDANGDQILVQCHGYDSTVPSFTQCATQDGVASNPKLNSGAAIVTNALSQSQTATIGGFLKVERQDTAGVWHDVTTEILNYGIGGPNLDGTICADPTANAILRIQRLRDNGGTQGANGGGCNYAGSTSAWDYWPNALFDTREGLQRDVAPAAPNNVKVTLGGVMYYVSIDAANLAKWFMGTAPFAGGTGTNSKTDNNGFTVYFSDRRNNRTNAAIAIPPYPINSETGEYGFEDFVNPASATGAPNSTLDVGEDINASGVLDVYGETPNYNGVASPSTVPPGGASPLDTTARPTTFLLAGAAQVNRSVLFRHALKLIHGNTLGTIGITGLTVVSENPVYVQGDWNANGAFNDPHAATSVIADAVTLLSGNWNDTNSFTSPYDPTNRVRTQSWYRLAIVSGKGMAFPQPSGTATDFGTDGGAHNFLRLLEDGSTAVNYRGSIATFFYNRQAVGTYKCCTTVYFAPASRNFAFDTDFLTPALLPPNTPVFRDMNAIGFSQELRPNK